MKLSQSKTRRVGVEEQGGVPDRVWITLGVTNSINYQSVKVEVGMAADVQDGETADTLLQRVEQICDAKVKRIITEKRRQYLDD